MLKNYKLLFKNGEKLDLAGLSEKERTLVQDCTEALDLNVEIEKIRLDPYFGDTGETIESLDEYKRLDRLTSKIIFKFIEIMDEMKESNEVNYEFLDICLYSSINIYLAENSYGIQALGEFILPIAKVIIADYWEDIHSSKFRNSQQYFLNCCDKEMFNKENDLVQDTDLNYFNYFSFAIGNVLKVSKSPYGLERENYIKFIESLSIISSVSEINREAGLKNVINYEFGVLAILDFNKLNISDLNIVLSILDFFSNLDNNSNIVKSVIKNVFDYIESCVEYLEINKESTYKLVVDEINYNNDSNVSTMIEYYISKIDFSKISCFYNQMEFERKVRIPLAKLLQITYYREYIRKISDIMLNIPSKDTLEMDLEIPF